MSIIRNIKNFAALAEKITALDSLQVSFTASKYYVEVERPAVKVLEARYRMMKKN